MVNDKQIVEHLTAQGMNEGQVARIVVLLMAAVDMSFVAGLTDKEFRVAVNTLHWIYQSLPERSMPQVTTMAPMSKVTH